jgi:hypothetical protein
MHELIRPFRDSGQLSLIREKGGHCKGLLKMQHNDRPESHCPDPDSVFRLSDFTTIETDSKDRHIVSLLISRSGCILISPRDQDIAQFLVFVDAKVHLKNSDCNPAMYLLQPLDAVALDEAGFSATALPQQSRHANTVHEHVALQRIEHPEFSGRRKSGG